MQQKALLIHEFFCILYLGLGILWENCFWLLWKTGIKNEELNVHHPSWAVICVLWCCCVIKPGYLLKRCLFLLIDWPFLKLPLSGEIPDLKQTQMCCQKIRSGSGWLNASSLNSWSYLQVYLPFNFSLPAISGGGVCVCEIYIYILISDFPFSPNSIHHQDEIISQKSFTSPSLILPS